MFHRILFSMILVLSVSVLAAQKRSIVYPFKDILKDIDTLVIQGGPRNNKGESLDTIYKMDIVKLENLYFQQKDFSVEAYGIPACGNISLFTMNGKTTINCWEINDTYYAVNIRVNDKLAFRGLLISQAYFDKLFEKLKKQTL